MEILVAEDTETVDAFIQQLCLKNTSLYGNTAGLNSSSLNNNSFYSIGVLSVFARDPLATTFLCKVIHTLLSYTFTNNLDGCYIYEPHTILYRVTSSIPFCTSL